MFGLTVLVAAATLVLGQKKGDRPCNFSQDCKVYECMADAHCVCNHGDCVTVGHHPSLWINRKIPKDCNEGGYMDCDCKYVFIH